jgi:hypothetical protein
VRLLLEACAAFIDARVPVPRDIRHVVVDLLERGDELAFFQELDKFDNLEATGKLKRQPV